MWNPVNHFAPYSSSSSGHGAVPVPGPLRNFSAGTVASTTLAEAGYTIGTLVSKKDDDQHWEIQKLEDATVTLSDLEYAENKIVSVCDILDEYKLVQKKGYFCCAVFRAH